MALTSFWRRIPLRTQGIIFNSFPLIAVLLSAGFAFFSNMQRERLEIALSRHFEMVENLVDVQTGLLGAEDALRAWMITRKEDALAHLKTAGELLPQKLARIHAIVASIPNPVRRADKLALFNSSQGLAEEQLAAFTKLAESSRSANPANSPDTAASLAKLPPSDDALKSVADLRASEQRLLERRLERIRSVQQRDFLLIFLSAVIGVATRAVAMYFFHRRVVRRVRQLTENARKMRDGAHVTHTPSDSDDDIGQLERELARIGDFIADRKIDS